MQIFGFLEGYGDYGGTAQGSEEAYPDLQNLPFDPATEFLRMLKRDQEDE